MYVSMDGWIDGWMNGWMDVYSSGFIVKSLVVLKSNIYELINSFQC